MPFPFQMTFGGATPDELKANVAAEGHLERERHVVVVSCGG